MGVDSHPTERFGRVLEWLCDLSAALGGVIVVAMASMTVVSVVVGAFFTTDTSAHTRRRLDASDKLLGR